DNRGPSGRETASGDSNLAVSTPGAKGGTPWRFRANEETWSGRPFLDAIQVTLGVPPLRQLVDLQLGKADVVELSPELVRRAMQDNQRVGLAQRSEEHTSELQSRGHLVCRLLLEKKKYPHVVML